MSRIKCIDKTQYFQWIRGILKGTDELLKKGKIVEDVL
jgi:hypothetical protein